MNEKNGLGLSFLFPFLIILIIWVVFYFDITYKLSLNEFGILPRKISSLPGVISHFFIHANFNHVLSNTLPLLVLLLLLFVKYTPVAYPVFFSSILLSGSGVWFFGRSHENGIRIIHVGSSTVIFSLFGFLLLSGILRKNKQAMALSALVIFLYGYFVWGLFPFDRQISWEGHLSGLISGLLLAFIYRKKGPQPDIFPLLNDEDELENLPEEQKYWLLKNESESEQNEGDSTPKVSVRYFYKEKSNRESGTD
jgi:membrane associated rhomboid family serine protease